MKKSFAFGILAASSLLVACGAASNSSTPASAPASTPASTPVSEASSATPVSEASSVTPVQEASSEAPAEATVVYAVSGSNDELYNMFGAFEFYGFLYSDNTGIIYRATVGSTGENKNIPVVDEADNLQLRYKVTVDDEEGVSTLEASINKTKYTGYQDQSGNFVIKGFKFTFAGSYSRPVDFTISETVPYATVDAWKEAIAEKYASRVVEATVQDTFAGPVYYADGENEGQAFMANFGSFGTFPVTAKLEVLSDFTAKLVYGVGGANGGASFDGTWSVNNDTVHVITYGENKQIVGVKDGAHEKFTWNIAHEVKDEQGAVVSTINLTAELVWVDPTATN